MLSEDLEKAATGELSSVQEASLGRIYQHHKNRAFVILTSWRGDESREANVEALKALKKQIRGAGYGFIPLEGVGQETRGGNIVQAIEPSLLVPNTEKGGDDGSFIKKAMQWARAPGGNARFKQDYIFYANGAGEAAVLEVASGATEFKLKKFAPNSVGEFYSRLRSGRTFKYEWLGLKYGDPNKGVIHGMGMQAEGRVEIARYSETIDEWLETFAEYLG